MSVQFGRWNLDGKPVDPTHLANVDKVITPYGPDDKGSHARSNLSIIYRAFHTTKESRRETQPHVSGSGVVITWDGRLDNRAALIRRLRNLQTISVTDVSIVAAAYEQWGSNCFANLLGDWALSIWDARTCSLFLAKDPIGTRHLYYSIDNNEVTWSSILDPLVLFAGKSFTLCEEYIAGWFSFFPATHLTPYIGIHSVPPSSFVLIREAKCAVNKYWDFDPEKKIRYPTDAEYEEHFRAAFGEAVRRRIRADSPILAELSGGMDSSSIVCMADALIAKGLCETTRLDTVSYYNDSELNWNERPYFSRVEEKRSRTGCHIDISSQEFVCFDLKGGRFHTIPALDARSSGAMRRLAECVTSQGNRTLLSGIGGDEVMGGVPTPIPEIADLLTGLRIISLARQLKLWALNKRKPWFHLLFEAVRDFLPTPLTRRLKCKRPPPWLNCEFAERNRLALSGYDRRLKLLAALPTFQVNLASLDVVRRQLACRALPLEPLYEKCYPFLDRELLEFLFAIPREQFVRPGQRRSLMRRALAGIVPHEILNRKRKAFVARAPIAAISRQYATLLEMSRQMVSASMGIVTQEGVATILHEARLGHEIPLVPLLRTLVVECWLGNLRYAGIIKWPTCADRCFQSQDFNHILS